MIFLTLVFIAWTLAVLTKGKLFYDDLVLLGEYNLAKEKGESTYDQQNKANKAALKVIIVVMPMMIANILYLIHAISIDPYKYPTIIVLAYTILNFVFSLSKKKDKLETEMDVFKYKAKLYRRYTVLGFVRNIAWLGYYSYMFCVLVFGL